MTHATVVCGPPSTLVSQNRGANLSSHMNAVHSCIFQFVVPVLVSELVDYGWSSRNNNGLIISAPTTELL